MLHLYKMFGMAFRSDITVFCVYHWVSRDSVVGMAIINGLDGLDFESRRGSFLQNRLDWHWGPPSLPFIGYWGTQRPGREVDHSPPFLLPSLQLLITARDVLQPKLSPLHSDSGSKVVFASVCFCNCVHWKFSGVFASELVIGTGSLLLRVLKTRAPFLEALDIYSTNQSTCGEKKLISAILFPAFNKITLKSLQNHTNAVSYVFTAFLHTEVYPLDVCTFRVCGTFMA
jgi:hypothetical protein